MIYYHTQQSNTASHSAEPQGDDSKSRKHNKQHRSLERSTSPQAPRCDDQMITTGEFAPGHRRIVYQKWHERKIEEAKMLKISQTRRRRVTDKIRDYSLNIAIMISVVALFVFLIFMNFNYLRCS